MVQRTLVRFWKPGYLKSIPLILLFLLSACTVPVRALGPNATPTPVPFHPAPASGGIGGGAVAPGLATPTAPAILVVETPTSTPPATPTATATASATPTALAAAPTPTSVAANTGFVNVAALNVRAGPGIAYPIVAAVPGGTQFTVLGQDPTGEWLYVVLSDGSTGWVTRSLTTYAGQAPAISVPPLPAVVATPTPTPTSTPSVSLPGVQLLAPGANASFVTGSQVTVQWTATDNSGIALAQVEVLVDNAVVLTTAGNGQTSLQASQQWQATTLGSHTISVIAADVRGNTSAAASVTIYVTSSSPTSFTVYFTQPSGNIVVVSGQGVTVNSTASGPNGINRIELWSDGSLYTTTSNGSPSAVGQAQTFSASQTWSSSSLGQHTIFVRAWDQAGNSVDSGSLTIGVVAGGPPQLLVSFSNTTLNVGQALVVNTTATDSKGVTDIELWVNGAEVAVTTSGSSVGVYQLTANQSWVPTSAGQYSAYVLAHDTQGLVGQSATTTVTVLGATATPASTPFTPTLTPTPTPETPTLTPIPETPTPTSTPSPTPAPTGTPAPSPTPGRPTVSLIRPSAGFTVQLPAAIGFTVQARAEARLVRIEVWGDVPGAAGAQMLRSFDVTGRYQSVVGFNYTAAGAGPASFYAVAFDSAGAFDSVGHGRRHHPGRGRRRLHAGRACGSPGYAYASAGRGAERFHQQPAGRFRRPPAGGGPGHRRGPGPGGAGADRALGTGPGSSRSAAAGVVRWEWDSPADGQLDDRGDGGRGRQLLCRGLRYGRQARPLRHGRRDVPLARDPGARAGGRADRDPAGGHARPYVRRRPWSSRRCRRPRPRLWRRGGRTSSSRRCRALRPCRRPRARRCRRCRPEHRRRPWSSRSTRSPRPRLCRRGGRM